MGSREGVIKLAAKRLGMSLEEYQNKISNGLKHCTKCKTWQPREAFPNDSSRGDGLEARCRTCNYRRKRHIGGPDSARSQTLAVEAVRGAIRNGRMVKPITLPCFYCGGNAIEYHHYQGYDEAHRLDVRATCISCHRKLHYV